MKVVVRIFIVIFIIIAVPLIAAIFLPRDYHIERTVVINKTKDVVFNYVKLLKNQDHYSKWVMTDPGMRKWYKGTDGTEGFVYGWNGNSEAGEGEQEITKVTPGEKIDIEVRFVRPMKSIAYTPITVFANGADQSSVKWECTGRNKYPCNFMNLFMNKMLGEDMEQSLNTLKTILEK